MSTQQRTLIHAYAFIFSAWQSTMGRSEQQWQCFYCPPPLDFVRCRVCSGFTSYHNTFMLTTCVDLHPYPLLSSKHMHTSSHIQKDTDMEMNAIQIQLKPLFSVCTFHMREPMSHIENSHTWKNCHAINRGSTLSFLLKCVMPHIWISLVTHDWILTNRCSNSSFPTNGFTSTTSIPSPPLFKYPVPDSNIRVAVALIHV